MAEDTDQSDRIAEIIQGPASASGDTGSMTQQNVRDVIEADKYLSAKRSAGRGGLRGVGICKIKMPGNG